MNGGRSPLFAHLRRLFARTFSEPPRPQLTKATGAPRLARREFLAASLTAAALPAWQGQPPRVVIAGAGMAGLAAGLHLKDKGIRAAIYEASPRTGGRILTGRNLLGEGITTEIGAEFIDTSQADMLGLAKRFQLPLNDIQAPGERGLIEATWLFNGKLYTDEQVAAEFQGFAPVMARDARSLKGGGFTRLDRMSIAAYFDRIGCTGWLRSLLEVAYVAEYGLDTGEQSSLNLLYRIGTDLAQGFKIYGESDERYRVLGGNDQVPAAIHAELKDQVLTGHRLEALRTSTSGGYTVTFRKGA
jgi:monoamine oxidase